MGEHARKQIEQFDVYEFSWGDRTDQQKRAISLSSRRCLYVWDLTISHLTSHNLTISDSSHYCFPCWPVQVSRRLVLVTTIINLRAFRNQSLVYHPDFNKNIGRHGIKCSWTFISIRRAGVPRLNSKPKASVSQARFGVKSLDEEGDLATLQEVRSNRS